MKLVALGEVARIERNGVDPSTLSPETAYLGLEHIERGGRIIGHETLGTAQPSSTKFSFSREHVLIGKLRPNLGKIARPDFSGVCSTDILPIRPGDRLNRDFLTHYMRQPEMIAFAASRAAGANLPRLSPTVLAKFEIPLPPIDEQRRIAAILDHADTIRAKRRQVLVHLDTLAQSIFHDMFAMTPWTSSLGLLASIQIGPFGSLLHREDYVDGGVPVLNPMHIVAGELRPDAAFSVTDAKASTLNLYRIRPGDVILGRRGEMGRAGMATAEHSGMVCGTGSLVLRPRETNPVFLHSLVTSPRMRVHLERSSLGATLPNLNATIVRAAPAPAAPGALQRKFACLIRKVKAHRDAVQRALAADDELFASLHSRAFHGGL